MKPLHHHARLLRSHSARLALEALEERRLLAELTPLMPPDDGIIRGSEFATMNGFTYFTTYTPPGLWKSDGTVNGTRLLSNDFSHFGLGPPTPAVIGEKLYFPAVNPGTGLEPWVSDGTEHGTRLLKDLVDGNAYSHPSYFTEFQGLAYFIASDQDGGQYLWRSDGTSEGTVLTADLSEYYGPAKILGNWGGKLVVTSLDYSTFPHQARLWSFSPSGSGPELIAEVFVSQNSVAVNGEFYFAASDDSGLSLWKTDGSREGTDRIFQDVSPFTGALGSSVFFLAAGEKELWKLDVETEQFTLVSEVPGRGVCCSSHPFVEGENVLFFTDPDDALWRTDGTDEGTFRLGDVRADSSDVVAWNGTLFFSKFDAGGLWRSDGTQEGTVKVLENPASGSAPHQLSVSNGALFFWNAFDGSRFIAWSWRPNPGDTNFDDRVDIIDLNSVRNNFGYVGDDRPGDVTGDGQVDLRDLNEVRNHFGEDSGSADVVKFAAFSWPALATTARDHALVTLIWLRSSQESTYPAFAESTIGHAPRIARKSWTRRIVR